MFVVGIKFGTNAKVYNFLSKEEVVVGQHVVVPSQEYLSMAEVVDVTQVESSDNKSIIRIATAEDIVKDKQNKELEKKARLKFNQIHEKHDLGMKLSNVEYSLCRKRLQFQYSAKGRVDFRNILKDLISEFKTKIELKQIGERDKAKTVGGIGCCGKTLCCSTFMKSFDSVSIKMAKNQELSLNPNVITGCCGKLKCCLRHEDATYTEEKAKLPKKNDMVKFDGQQMKVVSVDVVGRKMKLKDKEYNMHYANIEDVTS